ncbi:MAG TPA: hypothetical protein VMR23_02495 [Candidatus Limnocylindria bacterium]|nr:hypothetical protein [Candidatus Limnocylindria bacterium]
MASTASAAAPGGQARVQRHRGQTEQRGHQKAVGGDAGAEIERAVHDERGGDGEGDDEQRDGERPASVGAGGDGRPDEQRHEGGPADRQQ